MGTLCSIKWGLLWRIAIINTSAEKWGHVGYFWGRPLVKSANIFQVILFQYNLRILKTVAAQKKTMFLKYLHNELFDESTISTYELYQTGFGFPVFLSHWLICDWNNTFGLEVKMKLLTHAFMHTLLILYTLWSSVWIRMAFLLLPKSSFYFELRLSFMLLRLKPI